MLLDSGIPKSAYRPIRLGIAGAVAVWFSHPASFVLAGAGITWTLLVLARREWRSLSGLLPLLAAWSLSFAAFYLVSLRGLSQSPILLKYWDAKFLPWPLWSLRNIPWVFDHFLVLLRSSAGLTDILGAALFVAGCGALFLTSKPTAALLTLPAAVALLASALHRYPIEARFMLFFVPNLLLLVAEGTVWIGDKVRYFSLPVTAVLITALFAQPVLVTGHELLWPYYPDHIKPVIVYMRSNAQPGDGWFIYQSARYQFLYYAELYHLPLENVVTGPDCGGDSRCYTANLDGFANKRVWVLFSHIMIPDGVREERLFLQHLDHVGRRLEVHNSTDARAYLYDLSAPPAPGDR